MKKSLLITLLCLLFYSISHAQLNDSIVHISGRVFNATTMQYEPNTDIWVNESYKITTNDTGFFEYSFKRYNYFPSENTVKLNVKNCDGWWKFFTVDFSTNFTSTINDLLLPICDSTLNPNINEPLTLTPIGVNTFQINTNAVYYDGMINDQPMFFDMDGGINIFDSELGVQHIILYDDMYNVVSDNYAPAGITESQIPCNFYFYVSTTNTSDLGVFAYNYNQGNFFTSSYWTMDGLPFELNNSIGYAPSGGSHEVCFTSTVANSCTLQRCSTITVLSESTLCTANFTINNDFGYELVPEFNELNINSEDNADSMTIKINGVASTYSTILNQQLYLNQANDNEICLKIYRNNCVVESCQNINIPAIPAPSGCVVPMSLYLTGFSDNVLYANVQSDIVANSFHWDFGDGATSDQPNNKHTYTQSGTYHVTLTTQFNECTATSTDTLNIDIDSGCNQDFSIVKQSENRVSLWNNLAYFYLPNNAENTEWIANGEIIGTGDHLYHQFPTNGIYTICEDFNIPGMCDAGICRSVDLSSDTLQLRIDLQGFGTSADFSDSKLVLYEFIINPGAFPTQMDTAFQVGFAVRDTIGITSDSTAFFTNLFSGLYGVKFIPGAALGDTSILPSYSRNQLIWDQMSMQYLQPNYSGYHIPIIKRTLVDNLGNGFVVGNVNYGPFRLSEDANPLEKANLILFCQNKPVRFLPLNGNSTFELTALSNGAYTLMLDLPGYKTSTASFILTDENQNDTIVLNYDPIVFDSFEAPDVINMVETTEKSVLYPNPVNDMLFLTHSKDATSISIFDLSGKACNNAGISLLDDSLMIDVSNLQNGFYIITFYTTQGKKEFRKFIKK